jgi:hypothetical protein
MSSSLGFFDISNLTGRGGPRNRALHPFGDFCDPFNSESPQKSNPEPTGIVISQPPKYRSFPISCRLFATVEADGMCDSRVFPVWVRKA